MGCLTEVLYRRICVFISPYLITQNSIDAKNRLRNKTGGEMSDAEDESSRHVIPQIP